jgi:predicted Mrr-cat superfamily restriction endonuclease
VNEIQKGDWVITYSPANRTYLLGKVTSDFQYHPEWVEEGWVSLGRLNGILKKSIAIDCLLLPKTHWVLR